MSKYMRPIQSKQGILMLVRVRMIVSKDRGTNRQLTRELSYKNPILRLEIAFYVHFANNISTMLNNIIQRAFFPILGSKVSEFMPSTIVENSIRVTKLRIGIYSSSCFTSSLHKKISYSHSNVLKGTSNLMIFLYTNWVLTSKYLRIYWLNIFPTRPLGCIFQKLKLRMI